jgi:hypothetical protein
MTSFKCIGVSSKLFLRPQNKKNFLRKRSVLIKALSAINTRKLVGHRYLFSQKQIWLIHNGSSSAAPCLCFELFLFWFFLSLWREGGGGAGAGGGLDAPGLRHLLDHDMLPLPAFSETISCIGPDVFHTLKVLFSEILFKGSVTAGF